MGVEKFRFDGKRAMVVGGASGMGAAAARLLIELGAEVLVADVQDVDFPGAKASTLDLRDESTIDAMLETVDGPIDALFCCAGISDEVGTGLEVMKVNFIGQRHLIEGASARGLLRSGASVSVISSIAGFGWDRHLRRILDFLECKDFASAVEWIEANPRFANYVFSKQVFIAYCKRAAPAMLRRGIRINATGPAPTRTPLLSRSPSWATFADGEFEAVMGHRASTAEEQAYPLVFLGSDAAEFISGQVLYVDAGYLGGSESGAIESQVASRLARP